MDESKVISRDDHDLLRLRAKEQEVRDYLASLKTGLGTGKDPIGFLISSHAALSADLKTVRKEDL